MIMSENESTQPYISLNESYDTMLNTEHNLLSVNNTTQSHYNTMTHKRDGSNEDGGFNWEYPVKSTDTQVTYLQPSLSPSSSSVLRNNTISPRIQSGYESDTISVMTDMTSDTYNADTRLLDNVPYDDTTNKHKLGQWAATAITFMCHCIVVGLCGIVD